MNPEEIRKLFKPNCYRIIKDSLSPLHFFYDDKKKEKYSVKQGETLEDISKKMQKGEGEFEKISDEVKKPDELFYEHSWQYIADYNYGTSKPNVLNWAMTIAHGFDKKKNITEDKKNYKYKGGETLYYPIKAQKAKTGERKVYIQPDDTPGLILHPSFACPALVGTDSMLSILVIGNSEKSEITPEKVNIHLKILPWGPGIGDIKNTMISGKPATGFSKYLFKTNDEAKRNILVKEADFSDIIQDANGRYSFIPEKKVIKTYKDYKYNRLYRVEIHLKYLPSGDAYLDEGFYNLFWINKNKEIEDQIIQRKLGYYFGKKIYRSDNDKWYGFAIETRSLFFDKLQPKYPIASYHPFLYRKKEFFNLAHLADSHLVARMTLMKESKAKVIEIDDIHSVGGMINDHFDTTYDLLCQAGRDKNIDVILIGGDIVDYLKSFYPVQYVDKKNEYQKEGEYGYYSELKLENYYDTVGAIWDAVGVSNKDDAKKKYQDCVDLITVYSLFIHFYQNFKKPIYLISGNHDTYYHPYGVSPRVPLYGKANAGIPADMNLTIYESILCYGKNYGKILKAATEPSLKKKLFDIFHTLFTPMKDFALILPKFSLIGLGWGEDEDIIDFWDKIFPVFGIDEQGIGHLPRSDDAISGNQLEKVVEFALKKNKGKNILFTHFTFASYHESISFKSFKEGDIEFDSFWNASKFDMGTFETNRKKMYEKYLYNEKKIDYILTGHSHRRGLYEITDIDYHGDNSVKTQYYGFSHHGKIKGPKIIVSDSAGPIPRYNYDGEFAGWGSTTPTYTRMVFDNNGNLSDLKAVASRNMKSKPRFAVALDYIYIIEKFNVFETFKTDKIHKWKYVTSTDFYFKLQWNQGPLKKKKYKKYLDVEKLDIKKITIYYHQGGNFHKIPVSAVKNDSSNYIDCKISFDNTMSAEKFKIYVCDYDDKRTVFASIIFKRLSGPGYEHYNYESPYTFEIQMNKEKKTNHVFLNVKRDSNNNEIPDLKWRADNYREKYGTVK